MWYKANFYQSVVVEAESEEEAEEKAYDFLCEMRPKEFIVEVEETNPPE